MTTTNPAGIDHVLRTLRTSTMDPAEANTPKMREAWAVLTSAAADFVDVCRIECPAGYAGALECLDMLRGSFPDGPKVTVADLVEIDGLGPKAIES